jgi:hypothetical protein
MAAKRTTRLAGRAGPGGLRGDASGAVLLEVILAIGIFVAGAMVVLSGLTSCMQAVQRMRFEAQAGDLAVTKLSEIQMGLVPTVDDGPREFEEEDLAEWTWQVVVQENLTDAMDLTNMTRVEVIIRNDTRGYEHHLVCLLPAQTTTVAVEGASP